MLSTKEIKNNSNMEATAKNTKFKMLYVDRNIYTTIKFIEDLHTDFEIWTVPTVKKAFYKLPDIQPDIVVASHDIGGYDSIELLERIKSKHKNKKMSFAMVANSITPDLKNKAIKNINGEIVTQLTPKTEVKKAFKEMILKNAGIKVFENSYRRANVFKVPIYKRAMDIVGASVALILASPMFLVVAVALKLESKASVFYKSKRVGMGYKIFDLYKFRTMVPGADMKIGQMKKENMYNKVIHHSQCNNCDLQGKNCSVPRLYIHGESVCENEYLTRKNAEAKFKKFNNDPRITWLGKFLRMSSLDELPQLLNVLKGDMSLVGNRPLPLYEAELITSDISIQRFLAPAGITGLWQVMKRGKAEMSEMERIVLDNQYAKTYSLKMDMWIILKTFPALFQTANV
ncbi:MAG: sugar transferase [Bacteroidota bacterium]|nr:sugar transferase [Bacteroidota bacterium]